MFSVLAPAKINLTLEVLAERPDGYHEIRSLIQTVDLCDTFRFDLSQDIEFSCDNPEVVVAESLISRATALLQQATGCPKGATIEITKRIPLTSGLGGDSSDAAAILYGLNKLWQLGLSLKELIELAPRLGSDVPFFLYGGTALVEGRGEKITPLPPLPRMWVVLMVPPVSRRLGKTERLYASLEANHYTDGRITGELGALLTKGGEVAPSNLFNVFDSIAADSFAGLAEYWERFVKAGAPAVHLAGSGPTLFTLVKDRARAEAIHFQLQVLMQESYLAETLAAIKEID